MRLKVSPSIISVWLGLLLLSLSISAQISTRDNSNSIGAARGNHTIRGKIFLPSGQLPEHRIRVVLEVVSGGIYGETFSDTVGGFEFRSLPNNTYRVIVQSDGQKYEKAEETIEVSGNMSRTYMSQVFLREKENDNRARTNSKMISAAEFSQEVPKAAKKHYELGLKKMKEGKPDDAHASFQNALKDFPDYVLALNRVGEFQFSKHQLNEAEVTLKHALEVSPKFPMTQINLGMLMVEQKRFPEAIEYLEAANKLDESFPMAHLYLGIALLEKKPQEDNDLVKAERELSRALALGGGSLVHVHKYLFNIYVRRHEYNRAASELEAYLKDAPNAPDAAQVQDMIIKVKKAAQNQPTKPQ